ncbi:MAG: tetraacyldisaccharide 4'-kinase [Methylococcales bacterium]|nr:tetraacyldisaccharide 4'-kinase [Methylococcales bacterium]
MNSGYWHRLWYGQAKPAWYWQGLSVLFQGVVSLRRRAYRMGVKSVIKPPVPVIVVGNLTVGGTGKTPLTAWLANQLKLEGYRPGILCRGYRGRAKTWPQKVNPDSDPDSVGDEPVLLAQATGLPVMAGPQRVPSAMQLVDQGCDVLLSDDGLQHYALARTVEIVVVDGARGFGNGRMLPAGPLREPVARLEQADFIIINGANGVAGVGGIAMHTEIHSARNLVSGETRSLTAFKGQTVSAMAGIGNPRRFFQALRAQGLTITECVFPDHHRYRADDFTQVSGVVLMTEKDAIKCRIFAHDQMWSVPLSITFAEDWFADLLTLLEQAHG